MGCVDKFFSVRNTVLSTIGMLVVIMMAQATMPVAYAADLDDPRLPHEIIMEIKATRAQYRADVEASRALIVDFRSQKTTLVTDYRSACQGAIDRFGQIRQAMGDARNDFLVARSTLIVKMGAVRTSLLQLRRDYGMARRTMSAEEFAEFHEQYLQQVADVMSQYQQLRSDLTAAGVDYRNQINDL